MKRYLPLFLTVIFFMPTSYSATKKKFVKRKVSSKESLANLSQYEKDITKKLNKIILSVKPAVKKDGSPDYEKTEKSIGYAIQSIENIAKENPKSKIAQLYKAAVEHIPKFKGFIYRLRKIVETADLFHLTAVRALRVFKQSSNFRAPYMEALFDMATMPNPEKIILGQKGMFNTIGELQDWLIKEIAPRFTKTINEISEIAYNTGDASYPLALIDAELLVGEVIARRYEPSKNSHREWILTSGHVIGLTSVLKNYMGFMYYLSAYNFEKAAELSNVLMQETFVKMKGSASRSKIFSQKASRIELISSKRIFELTSDKVGKNSVGLFGKNSKGKVDRDDYRNFATIRDIAKKSTNGFSDYLKASEHFFTDSIRDQIQYHEYMVDSYGVSGEDKFIINPASYKAALDLTPYIDETEVLKKSLYVMASDKPIVLEDHLIKKSYTINTSILFDVEKVADLRDFLPNKFEDSRAERTPSSPSGINWLGGSGIQEWKTNYAWNYSYNKSLQWKDPTFAGLFPNINSEKQGDELNLHLLNIASLPELPFLSLWLSMYYGY